MAAYPEMRRIGLGDVVAFLEGSQYTIAAKSALALKPLQSVAVALDQIVNRVVNQRLVPPPMGDHAFRWANAEDMAQARRMAHVLRLAADAADEMVRRAEDFGVPLPEPITVRDSEPLPDLTNSLLDLVGPNKKKGG